MQVENNADHVSLLSLKPLSPNNIRLYLCRHGETDFNKAGLIQGRGINAKLNSTGQEQAQCLAKCVLNLSLDLICSSSLNRAIETAQVVCNYFPNVEHKILSDFDEMSFGLLEGTRKSSRDEVLNELKKQWRYDDSASFPNGESPYDVYTRGLKGLHQIVSDNQSCGNNGGKNILIVAHGRFLKILLSYILYENVDNISEQGNCCINVIDYCCQSKKFTPVALNFTGHIPAELILRP